MDDDNKDDTVPSPSPFRETVVDETWNIDGDISADGILKHYAKMPKKHRSHKDFDALVNLARMSVKKYQFAEKELWMSHQRLFGFAQANAGLIDLNKKLAKKIIKADDGEEYDNLSEVLKNYSKAVVSKVAKVSLNGENYLVSRAQLNHLFDWYCNGGFTIFKEGDEYVGPAETGHAVHKYSFGEIVRRKYINVDKTVAYEEVILCNEEKYIADVITATEIWCVGVSQNYFTMPRFVWMKDIAPMTPRRYMMDDAKMKEVFDDIMGVS